MVFAIMQFLLL